MIQMYWVNFIRSQRDVDAFRIVAKRYYDILTLDFNYNPIQDLNNTTDHYHTDYNHLAWFLLQIIKDYNQSITKKSRWLGYAQGILVKSGMIDVNEERNFTRDIFNGL